MKIFQKYISILYLKNLFIIFLALSTFFVGIDLLQHLKDIPSSANLQILYIIYKFLESLNYILPISLIFAMIFTKIKMIKNSELIALYSFGISKNMIITPIFLISLFITLIYIALNATPFAYSGEYAKNIRKYNTLTSTSSDLFLKNYDTYVYIRSLNPFTKEAKDLKLFVTSNGDLKEIINAKSGVFEDNLWKLKEVKIIHKPKISQNNLQGLKIEERESLNTLKDFKPKIITNIFEGKTSFTIIDAINAIKLLKPQDISIEKIKASLYLMTVFPLFAPFFILMSFYYIPISGRFFDTLLLSTVFVLGSLILWGILFILAKITINGILPPEIGIVLPIFILFVYSSYLYIKHK